MRISRTAFSLLLSTAVAGRVAHGFTATTTSRTTVSNVVPAAFFKRHGVTALASTTEEAAKAQASAADQEQVMKHHDQEECHARPLTPDFEESRQYVLKTLSDFIETKSLLEPLNHFVYEYFRACNDANLSGVTAITPQNTAQRILGVIEMGVKYGMGDDRYTFGVTHTALRGQNPDEEEGNNFDYYEFGCDFFRPVMDLEQSVVLGKENLYEAFEHVKKGHNVVFLANHQSEADPQVFSTMLEQCNLGKEASEITYVAGHKVRTDPLAVPFSMGRNLICIHSKKHIDSDPETKPLKQKQNLQAMNGMLELLKNGGAALWVAPSGGRDRRDVSTGEVPLAPFDQKTVDMFRLMSNKSKVPTHYYPLAMVSYDLCPPPDYVDPGVGEQRNVQFRPVGIACVKEVENVGGVESRHLFTEHAMQATQEGYEQLLRAMAEKTEK